MRTVKDTVLLIVFCLIGTTAELEASGQLRQLRFSWDGRYVLAQDASEIQVLTVDPFAVLFRVSAENATPAQFTPDSNQVAFASSITRTDPNRVTIVHAPTRVERWDVHTQMRLPPAILAPLTCGTVVLSPDGRTLVCLDFEGTLRVFEVESGERTLEIRKFSGPSFVWIELRRYDFPSDLGLADIQFSPDGRFVIAGPTGHRSTLIWEVRERRKIKLQGKLRLLDAGWNIQFAFLEPDRVLMSCGTWQRRYLEEARIVEFPSGKMLSKIKIPWSSELTRAADRAFLLVSHPYYADLMPLSGAWIRYPRPSAGTVAVELATGKGIKSNTAALDVFGNHYVAEVRPGEVGLYERGKGLQASVVLDKE